mmetsp:Transcript_70196/g.124942  ORF Transcript_70196/g.124942 Transcript_70196/m.124942 type:complete len:237 (+) Transcript_70196:2447-3157(+)
MDTHGRSEGENVIFQHKFGLAPRIGWAVWSTPPIRTCRHSGYPSHSMVQDIRTAQSNCRQDWELVGTSATLATSFSIVVIASMGTDGAAKTFLLHRLDHGASKSNILNGDTSYVAPNRHTVNLQSSRCSASNDYMVGISYFQPSTDTCSTIAICDRHWVAWSATCTPYVQLNWPNVLVRRGTCSIPFKALGAARYLLCLWRIRVTFAETSCRMVHSTMCRNAHTLTMSKILEQCRA